MVDRKPILDLFSSAEMCVVLYSLTCFASGIILGLM